MQQSLSADLFVSSTKIYEQVGCEKLKTQLSPDAREHLATSF